MYNINRDINRINKSGADASQIRQQAQEAFNKLPKVSGEGAQLYASTTFQRLVDQAWKEAQSLKDEYISKAHIVLAMLGANGAGLNVFSQKRT
ncbi:MAG TPA: hypothetical protein EYQ20_15035 [candidate division Zixibacteria bacterium]|nr:hypothetical protein [candidate division Zixibacteria bacterium]